MFRGSYGVNIKCPDNYIATGACAGGKGLDCGVYASTRLKCCRINVSSVKQSCLTEAASAHGQDISCTDIDGQLRLVTEYCGSGAGNDCAGGKPRNPIF